MQIRSFVGLDVHKASISISVAAEGRGGAVRFIGVIPNTAEELRKMAKKLAKHGELEFCYEASGCGYGIYRQLMALGHRCTVVAPSLLLEEVEVQGPHGEPRRLPLVPPPSLQ